MHLCVYKSIFLVSFYALSISINLSKIFQTLLFIITLLFISIFLSSLGYYYALGEFKKSVLELLEILLKIQRMIYNIAHKLQKLNLTSRST